MTDESFKRVQHFIPRFILNKFLIDGKYKIFDKRYGKSYDDKTPGGTMYKPYFYEHDDFNLNEIENLLSIRENVYAPVIEKIINKIPLTFDEHLILIEFRHVTYYRSNEFIGFHNYQKKRGDNDWIQRHDWKSINGIYNSTDHEKDIKKSQLKAIQGVIERKDSAYYMSSLTPLCFLFISNGDKKFIIGDSGSLCWGGEFDGAVIIVLSPLHAIMFPRLENAIKIMKKLGVTSQESTIQYEEVKEDIIDLINNKVIESSFEYYVY